MFEELTMSQLRSQIEQHLMMVEEVLGGMDTFIQRLEKRVSRIEEGLGLEPEGISASGWVATCWSKTRWMSRWIFRLTTIPAVPSGMTTGNSISCAAKNGTRKRLALSRSVEIVIA